MLKNLSEMRVVAVSLVEFGKDYSENSILEANLQIIM